jgi:hypothetical protein
MDGMLPRNILELKMNDRIKELAREAGLLVHNPEGVPTKLEKFAQLIVQECAEVIFETPVKYTEIDIMHVIRDRVKQHFEVT